MMTLLLSFLAGGFTFFFLQAGPTYPWLFSMALVILIAFVCYLGVKSFVVYKKSKLTSLDTQIKKEELKTIKNNKKGDKND